MNETIIQEILSDAIATAIKCERQLIIYKAVTVGLSLTILGLIIGYIV